MSKDTAEHWNAMAETLVKQLGFHQNGYKPEMANIENKVQALLALSLYSVYREEKKEGADPGTITLKMPFKESQALMALPVMLAIYEDILPEPLKKVFEKFKEDTGNG